MLTHLCEWDGKAANTAPTITHSLSLDISIGLDPVQNLLDGLVVPRSDIKLHRIHIIALRVNLVPAVESFGIEVFSDLCLVIHTRRKGNGNMRAARFRDKSRRPGEKQRKNGKGVLHGFWFVSSRERRKQCREIWSVVDRRSLHPASQYTSIQYLLIGALQVEERKLERVRKFAIMRLARDGTSTTTESGILHRNSVILSISTRAMSIHRPRAIFFVRSVRLYVTDSCSESQ